MYKKYNKQIETLNDTQGHKRGGQIRQSYFSLLKKGMVKNRYQ